MTVGHARRRAALPLAGLAIMATVALALLGLWQLERRVWKLGLIDRVEARVHSEPVAPPEPETWAALIPGEYEYRRVRMTGYYAGRDTPVMAVTEHGGGFWIVTPFVTDTGFTVLVNRGFVPSADRDHPAVPPQGKTSVTGLMRISEPDGAFLRGNNPADGLWFSRDVEAIARDLGLDQTAPFFIDAEKTVERATERAAPGTPIPGLTRLRFPNNHLVYALTWFGLAAMSAAGAVLLLRQGWGSISADGHANEN